ncbi:J domain-containing protein [Inhella gelatinilytica]|uniref:DnaJ domain-containing protein n=1 Tax=Inhella gelatinilytica TaxID=2795030 RepID=A0A931IYS2_9BURK|nr:DnaJ domain-containing protein [Inhella gelatinilytica]MBH9552473.1 DnaJ domain-containing protein [Inhella gelatinilytica]
MQNKPTLYELLGVAQQATMAEVRAAFRQAVEALEAQRAQLSSQEFNERFQLLRTAQSTLTDPVSRAGYDADLAPASQGSALISGPSEPTSPAPGAAAARADALGLQADALSLRAEALLARAQLESGAARRPPLGWSDRAPWAQRALRFFAVLGLMALLGFGLSRCSLMNAREQMAQREALENQAALQDYYQAHGVRPANMDELRLLEAERLRKENAERQVAAEQRRTEEAQRQWEVEAQRAGEEATRRALEGLREQQQEVERKRQLKFEIERVALELQYVTSEIERRRLELQLKQLRERLQAP